MPNIIGNPYNPFQQQYSDTCAIKSQQLILQEFGINVSENDCVNFAMINGWYNGNGTCFDDIGKILESCGIPCTQRASANIFDLVYELQQGHKVIVAVDSEELWDKVAAEGKDLLFGERADHALIVAGIDVSNPDFPKVLLTDPGDGSFLKEYPLDQFMDAWHDSDCYMVSTDIPPINTFNQFQQAGFVDYMDNGMVCPHLPMINGVD